MAQASFEVISAARRLQDAGFARTASRKHDQLDAAISLGDLARPGNRLEALRGRRNQWRVCFKWPEGNPGPTEVEIVDYH